MIVAANQDPSSRATFTTFAADTPQLYLDLDRDKAADARRLVNDLFTALQGTLGGIYVNDFNLFGRTWQVNMQADKRPQPGRRHLPAPRAQRDRRDGADPRRSPRSRLVARALSRSIRYNNYRARHDQRLAGAGRRLRRGARRDGASSRREVLPPGYGFEWTGTALQEKEAAGQTTVVLALAILFAYLFLVALYESWTIPIPVLLSVSVGVAGASSRL